MESQRYAITVDDNAQIIVLVFYGYVKLEELCEAWKALLNMPEFQKQRYGLLSDYTDVDLSFSVNKIDSIWEFLNSIQDLLQGRKQAVITTRPLTTAMSVLIENESFARYKYSIRTFSTREVAFEWLIR